MREKVKEKDYKWSTVLHGDTLLRIWPIGGREVDVSPPTFNQSVLWLDVRKAHIFLLHRHIKPSVRITLSNIYSLKCEGAHACRTDAFMKTWFINWYIHSKLIENLIFGFLLTAKNRKRKKLKATNLNE